MEEIKTGRQKMVPWKKYRVPEDMLDLMGKLEAVFPPDQVSITVAGRAIEPVTDLGHAGRELWFSIQYGVKDRREALASLWSQLVPMGLTPWTRYPIPHPEDHVFHVFGVWQRVYDRLIAEGRGHLAWPSLCAAALCDVGLWRGNKKVERSVQTQLHRIGHSPGNIDGRIGKKTLAALRGAGLSDVPLKEALVILNKRAEARISKRPRKQGHVVLPGIDFTVHSFGGVTHLTKPGGADLAITGPGRVVVDLR